MTRDPASELRLPGFDELPLRSGDPKGSAWGLWGPDDELGTLNLITNEVTQLALHEAKLGRVVNLKYSDSACLCVVER